MTWILASDWSRWTQAEAELATLALALTRDLHHPQIADIHSGETGLDWPLIS